MISIRKRGTFKKKKEQRGNTGKGECAGTRPDTKRDRGHSKSQTNIG